MLGSTYLSKKITNVLVTEKVISENEQDMYTYCFDYMFESLFFIVSLLILGAFMHAFISSCIFVFVMFPLRTIVGGIHAPNKLICGICSYCAYFICIFLNEFVLALPDYILLTSFIGSMIGINILAPVDTPNKRLTLKQRRSLKKACHLFSLLLVIIYLFLYASDFTKYYSILTLCGMIVLAGLFLGKC